MFDDGTRKPTTSVGRLDSDIVPSRTIELELFHHFVLRTYKTCDHGMMSSAWWQETFPMLGARHEHLLYAVFSFTSLHIAHLRLMEAEQYTARATGYRDVVLKMLPALFSETDLGPEQAKALFWSSAFVGLISLAMYRHISPQERQTPTRLLLELATLWKGAETVGEIHTALFWTPDGTDDYNAPIPKSGPKAQHTAFDSILSSVRISLRDETGSGIEEHLLDRYVSAIDDLALAVRALESEGSFAGILSWPACLDKEILEHLSHSGDPSLNMLFVIYGVALHIINDIWYIQDLGASLIQELTAAIPLSDKERVRLVNWAREQVCG